MAYPIQPPPENAWQIAGNALMQGGGVLGSMRDMIEKRKMALIAQRQAELEAQQKAEALEMQKELQKQQIASSKSEMDLKSKDEARKAQEAEQKQNFLNIANTGKAVPIDYQQEVGPQLPTMEGSPLNPNVEFKPLTRDQYFEEGLKTGAMDLEKYASATKETSRNPLTKTSENNTILERDESGNWIDTGVPVKNDPYAGWRFEQSTQSNVFNQENTLRDEFDKKVNESKAGINAFYKLKQAVDRNNPTDAYASIINYVRTLDPQSTVREAEERLARERSSGSYLGRVSQSIENWKTGKLTPEVAKNLLESGKGLADVSAESYKNTRDDFLKRISVYKDRGYDLDDRTILGDDLYQSYTQKVGGSKQDNTQPKKETGDRGKYRSITPEIAQDYYLRAGKDRAKAKKMLAKDGYNISGSK